MEPLGARDVQYGYDADGKQNRLFVTSAGYDYTFGYDPLGRFEKILSSNVTQFQYSYDAASNETQRLNVVTNVAQVYGGRNGVVSKHLTFRRRFG